MSPQHLLLSRACNIVQNELRCGSLLVLSIQTEAIFQKIYIAPHRNDLWSVAVAKLCHVMSAAGHGLGRSVCAFNAVSFDVTLNLPAMRQGSGHVLQAMYAAGSNSVLQPLQTITHQSNETLCDH